MTPREKIDAAVAYLKKRKVAASTAAPPLYRLLWSMGLHIPPPHFQSFFTLALGMGVPFGLIMGLVFGLMARGGDLFLVGLGTGLVAGAFFGLTMAGYFRWSAAKLNLPRWSDFDPELAEETKPARDEGW